MPDQASDQARPKPFRVLSVDGGGMRGIYTAAYLAWLSDRFARERGLPNLDVGKGFDLVTGTSTGAIIACAAAMGVPMAAAHAMIAPVLVPVTRSKPLPTSRFGRDRKSVV